MSNKTPQHRNKKFYYRRAKWHEQGTVTLQNLMEKAHAQLSTVGKRTFSLNSGSEIRGADFKVDNGLFLQIASFVPGESTSIIENNKSAKSSVVEAQNAPTGKDYLDGDVFVYVIDNHVILCPSGVREKVAENYFWHVLKEIDLKDIAKTFELDKVAKASKIKMIKDEGVKEIDLDSTLYEASLVQIDRQSPKVSNLKKAIADQLVSLFAKDKDLKEIKERENLNVRLTLKFDGREAMKHSKDPEFGVSGKSRLEKTAEEIIAEYDEEGEAGFIIETFSGNKITAEEIRVSDTFKVKTLGKSISKQDAWNILKEYHDRLESEGVFSQ